ncbi:MAG: Cell division protein CrgA [uncultured Actinomycetospora sp.]|uniref:Cell division protein CrgA n=1 Tax=uncultured Actinomycetospora sp. TaxID=1135996 RepID=A0A6J4J9I6_9PSEU|nr:MAG: Cell division protein CrgA [uncultured Actinomycetospora sp.]
MPESKKRKRPERTSRPTTSATGAKPVRKGPSPRWLAPLMLVLFGIGVLWLVVFYITQAGMGGLPWASDIGNWNLLVGFGFIIAGFGLSTQWR